MTAALYTIINGNTADTDGYFEIPGNFTSQFTVGAPFVAVDSNGSPATVQGAISTTVNASSFVSGNTRIVPDDGSGLPLAIPTPNGSYTTIGGGAYSLDSAGANGTVVVPASARDSSSTSLTFPGRAVLNFGENINENFYNLLENFANSTAPSNPVTGQLWYDSAGGAFYYWDGASWVLLGAGGGGGSPSGTIGIGGFSFEYEFEEVAVASKTVFTLSSPYTPTPEGEKLLVYVNGVKYQPDTGSGGGYTETDPNTVTFTDPVTINKIVEFYKVVPNVSGSRLGDLTDVIYGAGSPSPALGDVLTFDGSDWTNQQPSGGLPSLGSPNPAGSYTAADITVNTNGQVTAASSNTLLAVTEDTVLYEGPDTIAQATHGLGAFPEMVQVFIQTPGGDGLFVAGTRLSLNHPLDIGGAGSPIQDDEFGITVEVDTTDTLIRVASNGIAALAKTGGSPGTNEPQILTPLAWNFVIKVLA